MRQSAPPAVSQANFRIAPLARPDLIEPDRGWRHRARPRSRGEINTGATGIPGLAMMSRSACVARSVRRPARKIASNRVWLTAVFKIFRIFVRRRHDPWLQRLETNDVPSAPALRRGEVIGQRASCGAGIDHRVRPSRHRPSPPAQPGSPLRPHPGRNSRAGAAHWRAQRDNSGGAGDRRGGNPAARFPLRASFIPGPALIRAPSRANCRWPNQPCVRRPRNCAEASVCWRGYPKLASANSWSSISTLP
jgi:hypothetical protein